MMLVGDEELQLGAVIRVAEEAARAGGDLIRANLGAASVDTKLNAKDLLTEIDPMVEREIQKRVRENFPTHDFLGEESVPAGPEASSNAIRALLEEGSTSDWLWIVDPIDGTINFVHSMPLSAVSIGVAYKGEIVAGVIYDPFHDELFSASRGRGAFLNGRAMMVDRQAHSLEEAVIAGGSPPNPRAMGPCNRGTLALMPKVRTMRFLGSAAIMFAWVACGRLTGYFEADLNAWDIAAGAILISEAGGAITDIDGSPYQLTTRAVVCSNGLLHDEIRTILMKAGTRGLDPA